MFSSVHICLKIELCSDHCGTVWIFEMSNVILFFFFLLASCLLCVSQNNDYKNSFGFNYLQHLFVIFKLFLNHDPIKKS